MPRIASRHLRAARRPPCEMGKKSPKRRAQALLGDELHMSEQGRMAADYTERSALLGNDAGADASVRSVSIRSRRNRKR